MQGPFALRLLLRMAAFLEEHGMKITADLDKSASHFVEQPGQCDCGRLNLYRSMPETTSFNMVAFQYMHVLCKNSTLPLNKC